MKHVYWTGFMIVVLVLVSDVWFTIDYRIAAHICLSALAAVVTGFTTQYAWRSNWKANHIGRVFLVKGILLSTVLWQGTVSAWGGDYLFRDPIRFLIYAAGLTAYAAMWVTLRREQRRDRAR